MEYSKRNLSAFKINGFKNNFDFITHTYKCINFKQ